ncbi:MAG: hypothetical protein ACO3B3_07455 [Cyanobium sp.]
MPDSGTGFRGIPGAEEAGQNNGGEDTDDRNNDHQFHKREALGQAFALAQLSQQFELGFSAHEIETSSH